jgi:hypothetical protein
MANTNRTSTQGKDQQVIVGVQKDLQTMSSIPLGATTYTPTSLVALVQSRIDAANAVTTAKANWQSAAKTYEATDTQVTVVVRELRNLVIAAFGPTSPKLGDFGFAAPKKTPLTTEQQAVAIAKREATRKARGTLGKKQKAKITGATPPVTPAPATAPVAIAPVQPAPAPQAVASTAPAVALVEAPAVVAPATPQVQVPAKSS